MSLIRKTKQRKARKQLRVRKKIHAIKTYPRVSIFRSSRYFYGQLIDDNAGSTLASSSSLEMDKKIKGDKKAVAKEIGLDLAKKAKQAGVVNIRFDRGRFLYHGRVKAFADGLREGGLKF